VGELGLDQNSFEASDLEECFFSVERWLPRDDVVVDDVCDEDLLGQYSLW
jgi:hypothetical protein